MFLGTSIIGYSFFPMLFCLYSQFPKENQGKVTGIAFAFFGFGGIVSNFLVTLIINPENKQVKNILYY